MSSRSSHDLDMHQTTAIKLDSEFSPRHRACNEIDGFESRYHAYLRSAILLPLCKNSTRPTSCAAPANSSYPRFQYKDAAVAWGCGNPKIPTYVATNPKRCPTLHKVGCFSSGTSTGCCAAFHGLDVRPNTRLLHSKNSIVCGIFVFATKMAPSERQCSTRRASQVESWFAHCVKNTGLLYPET